MTEGLDPLHNRRILVIEDDAYNIAMMSTLLRRAGAKVFFERWSSALQPQKFLPLDLILLDLDLPHTDGLGMYTLLRATPAFQNTPILVVTAIQNPQWLRQLQAAGLQGYISKPLNGLAFSSALQRALAGENLWLAAI